MEAAGGVDGPTGAVASGCGPSAADPTVSGQREQSPACGLAVQAAGESEPPDVGLHVVGAHRLQVVQAQGVQHAAVGEAGPVGAPAARGGVGAGLHDAHQGGDPFGAGVEGGIVAAAGGVALQGGDGVHGARPLAA